MRKPRSASSFRHGERGNHLFDGYVPKPDILIDDAPVTAQAPFAYSVERQTPWTTVVDRIIREHGA